MLSFASSFVYLKITCYNPEQPRRICANDGNHATLVRGASWTEECICICQKPEGYNGYSTLFLGPQESGGNTNTPPTNRPMVQPA